MREQPSKEKFISAPTDGYIHTHTRNQRSSEERILGLKKAGKEGAVEIVEHLGMGGFRDGEERAESRWRENEGDAQSLVGKAWV